MDADYTLSSISNNGSFLTYPNMNKKQILLDWINTINEPMCLLVTDTTDLVDGLVFVEIVRHYLYLLLDKTQKNKKELMMYLNELNACENMNKLNRWECVVGILGRIINKNSMNNLKKIQRVWNKIYENEEIWLEFIAVIRGIYEQINDENDADGSFQEMEDEGNDNYEEVGGDSWKMGMDNNDNHNYYNNVSYLDSHDNVEITQPSCNRKYDGSNYYQSNYEGVKWDNQVNERINLNKYNKYMTKNQVNNNQNDIEKINWQNNNNNTLPKRNSNNNVYMDMHENSNWTSLDLNSGKVVESYRKSQNYLQANKPKTAVPSGVPYSNVEQKEIGAPNSLNNNRNIQNMKTQVNTYQTLQNNYKNKNDNSFNDPSRISLNDGSITYQTPWDTNTNRKYLINNISPNIQSALKTPSYHQFEKMANTRSRPEISPRPSSKSCLPSSKEAPRQRTIRYNTNHCSHNASFIDYSFSGSCDMSKQYTKNDKAVINMSRGVIHTNKQYTVSSGDTVVKYAKWFRTTDPIIDISYNNMNKYKILSNGVFERRQFALQNSNNKGIVVKKMNTQENKVNNNTRKPSDGNQMQKEIQNIHQQHAPQKSNQQYQTNINNQPESFILQDNDGIPATWKQKVYLWLVDIGIVKEKVIEIDDLPKICINGVWLCDWVNRCEGRNEMIHGIIRKTTTRSQIQVNINKVLEYLRSWEKFKSRHLWNNAEIARGNKKVIWELWDDIYTLYSKTKKIIRGKSKGKPLFQILTTRT